MILGVWGICSPTNAKISRRNLQYPAALRRGFFIEQIDTVTIIEKKTTTFLKLLIPKHETGLISEWQIDTIVNEVCVTSIETYLHKGKQFETCIITQKKDDVETIFRLTSDYPRLFWAFPLIGTEEIGIPIIINSTNFKLRGERDAIYLKSSENENNKKIIREALLNSLKSFAELFITKNINGIFELFDFNCDNDNKFEWIDKEWFTSLKADMLDLLVSKEINKNSPPQSGGELNHQRLNMTIRAITVLVSVI